MTLNAKRRKAHAKLAALPGVRAIRRPVTPDGAKSFNLYYVRSGPPSPHPVVVIPGGPGIASVQLYQGFRRRAAAKGLDVIMVEHRGVGMSRHDDDGADLPPAAMTVDQVVEDIAAVLSEADIDNATVYGTSYGSYVAAGLGVRHPGRVQAMVLDSPVLSAHDFHAVRDAVRDLLLDGTGSESTRLVPKARQLLDRGILTSASIEAVSVVYGYGGARLLEKQLDLLLSGRTLLWRGIEHVSALTTRKVPYRNEFDLVGRIAFRELDYVGRPDGLPLDPSMSMIGMRDQIAGAAPDFEAEPYDLTTEMPRFNWPTVVLSGSRDLITPPSIAGRVAALVPGATLVRLPSAAHSVIDFRERAALEVMAAVQRGEQDTLPARSAELDRLPSNPAMRLLITAISAASALQWALPGHPHFTKPTLV